MEVQIVFIHLLHNVFKIELCVLVSVVDFSTPVSSFNEIFYIDLKIP